MTFVFSATGPFSPVLYSKERRGNTSPGSQEARLKRNGKATLVCCPRFLRQEEPLEHLRRNYGDTDLPQERQGREHRLALQLCIFFWGLVLLSGNNVLVFKLKSVCRLLRGIEGDLQESSFDTHALTVTDFNGNSGVQLF